VVLPLLPVERGEMVVDPPPQLFSSLLPLLFTLPLPRPFIFEMNK
jgi:hypothetical protein